MMNYQSKMMTRWPKLHLMILLVIILVVGIVSFVLIKSGRMNKKGVINPADKSVIVESVPSSATARPASESTKTTGLKKFSTSDLGDSLVGPYDFDLSMPLGWRAESISAVEAISLYDPQAAGESDLEKSQIFIRYFRANKFLTLDTVTIHSRQELIVGGRPAVRYDIEKKPAAPTFPSQPSWRNKRHLVTDIRLSDASPSIFYVIASRPDLDPAIYQAILDSLKLR